MPINYNNLRLFGMFGLKLFKFSEDADGNYLIDVSANIIPWLIVAFLLVGIAAYLLGTFNFAIIISKHKYHEDIREFGSGNAGMTNMMRTYGRSVGIATFVLDFLKGAMAVVIGWFLLGEAGGYFAGFCCVLGHAFPVWYGFKGGKGVAVSTAMVFVLEPLVGVFLLVIFVAIVAFTKYLSLGSIMSMLMYPILLQNVYAAVHPQRSWLYGLVMLFCLLTSLLVIFLHRENMKRIMDHKENKFSFKKKGNRSENSDK